MKTQTAKGWFGMHKWLLLRRASQGVVLGLFLTGPVMGVWVASGTLTSSLTFGVLPLSDPFVLAQSVFAGHGLSATALTGGAVVLAFYAVFGGRVYCSFVCPMNAVTDAARWAAKRLGLSKGWQPKRQTRLWLLGATLLASAWTGILAWELINPVTLLQRGLIFGLGVSALAAAGVFLFDLLVSRRGWCGRLCPMGAFYGLIGSFALVRISATKRNDCDDCMDCYAVCPEPQVITPALRGAEQGKGPVVLSRDCTNCGRCIDVCAPNVFAFDFRFNNPAPQTEVQAGHDTLSPPRRAA